MTNYVQIATLSVATEIYQLITEELLPRTSISSDALWTGFSEIIRDLTPINQRLLQKRVELQSQIDEYLRSHKDRPFDAAAYKQFLYDIGYLAPEGPDFLIGAEHVDPEISELAAPNSSSRLPIPGSLSMRRTRDGEVSMMRSMVRTSSRAKP